MMSNILIVDDEKAIADLLEVYLHNEDFNVYKYYSSNDVLRDLNKMDIDLAILDVMMPEIDGFKLCSIIRKKYNFPIIFATAKVEDIDKITYDEVVNGMESHYKDIFSISNSYDLKIEVTNYNEGTNKEDLIKNFKLTITYKLDNNTESLVVNKIKVKEL